MEMSGSLLGLINTTMRLIAWFALPIVSNLEHIFPIERPVNEDKKVINPLRVYAREVGVRKTNLHKILSIKNAFPPLGAISLRNGWRSPPRPKDKCLAIVKLDEGSIDALSFPASFPC
jgi:hypothetical protein